jgi:hypothetical protein
MPADLAALDAQTDVSSTTSTVGSSVSPSRTPIARNVTHGNVPPRVAYSYGA